MSRQRPSALHLLSLAIALGIAVLLLRPVPVVLEAATQGSPFPYDKVVHFGLFAVAALPWRGSFAKLGRRSPELWAIGAAAAYGGLIEVAQGVWTARDAELLDMVAGALGAYGALGAHRAALALSRRYSGRRR
jgi:hypothetical protein